MILYFEKYFDKDVDLKKIWIAGIWVWICCMGASMVLEMDQCNMVLENGPVLYGSGNGPVQYSCESDQHNMDLEMDKCYMVLENGPVQ